MIQRLEHSMVTETGTLVFENGYKIRLNLEKQIQFEMIGFSNL